MAHHPSELPHERRTAVVDDFDGVHLGHRRLLAAAASAARRDSRRAVLAVVVDEPGSRDLLTTVERRLELLEEAGVDEALVLPRPPRPGVVAALDAVQILPSGVPQESPTAIARAHVAAGRVAAASALLGRPPEVEGIVVAGDARGAGLGFPTANLALPERLLVPRHGIYAGFAAGHRAAISIGTNPHYGGEERRIEAFLLDFEGDLYGRRLVVELWQRLRHERAFAGERELVEQIARDVEATRAAERPI